MSIKTWAMTAYQHAKYTLVIGCNNQPKRLEETGNWSDRMVKTYRHENYFTWVRKDTKWVQTETEKPTRVSFGNPSEHDFWINLANRSAEHRAGNCGAHAAVAYQFLYERARNKGIGSVMAVHVNQPGDHCFVIVGGPSEAEMDRGDDELSERAVIVDPWWGVVCYVGDMFFTTGNAIFDENEGQAIHMQRYVKKYDVDMTRSAVFDTGTPN